jgi:hypothetical protein
LAGRGSEKSLDGPEQIKLLIELHFFRIQERRSHCRASHQKHRPNRTGQVRRAADPEYESFFTSNGLQITHRENLNKNCAKTWDISLDIIGHKAFWDLALRHGPQFVAHLKAFQTMRAGFATGNFVYGLFVAKAPPPPGHA